MQEISLTTDVAASLDAMNEGKRGTKRVTWSRYQHYNDCPSSYFLSNFNKTTRPGKALPEDSLTIDGKVIQKVLEVYYKNDAFARTIEYAINRKTLPDLIRKGVNFLLDCTKISVSGAADQDITDVYGWFATQKGQAALTAAMDASEYKDPALEPLVLTKPTLIVLDMDNFSDMRRKTLRQVADQIIERTTNALYDLAVRLPRQRTGVEVWVAAEHDGFEFCGMVDFLHNTHANDPKPDKMWNIRDQYIMADGKNRINDYQTHEQNQFYATLIKAKLNKRPYSLALYDYSKSQALPVTWDPNYGRKIIETANALKQDLIKLRAYLKDAGDTVREPWKILPRSPGKRCDFCPARFECDLSTHQSGDERAQHRSLLAETDSIIASISPETDTGLPGLVDGGI